MEPDRGVKLCSYAGTAAFNAMRRLAGRQLEDGNRHSSIDVRPRDDSGRIGGTIAELLPAPEGPDPETVAEVRKKVAKLPSVYRVIVAMHFGLDGEPGGWNAIAAATGLTIPQAKRALDVALARL